MARCSWMKSSRGRWRFRSSCCAYYRSAGSSGSAAMSVVPVNCRIVAAVQIRIQAFVRPGRVPCRSLLSIERGEHRSAAIATAPQRYRTVDDLLSFASRASFQSREIPSWTEQDLFRWQHHDWPGNVRELKAVAERLCLSGDGLEAIQDRNGFTAARLDNYERGLIREALRGSHGNVALAAERLHLPKKRLIMLARHQLDPEYFRA